MRLNLRFKLKTSPSRQQTLAQQVCAACYALYAHCPGLKDMYDACIYLQVHEHNAQSARRLCGSTSALAVTPGPAASDVPESTKLILVYGSSQGA